MVLKFSGEWRFNPPRTGDPDTDKISDDAHNEFFALIRKTATQG